MVFDSLTFLAFFAAFFVVYYLASRSLRLQNAVVVAGSAIFYGWWDWRFLLLLLFTSGIDYVAGLFVAPTSALPQPARRRVLTVSLAANLGCLFVFKYFNFFVDTFASAANAMGIGAPAITWEILLPVGISFYTFQSMSYTIDVYRGDAEPERNVITYFAFVSFFPHMVAGPIQRAAHLLGQLNRPRVLDETKAREALWLLVYGYFLKSFVANGVSRVADLAFVEGQHEGWTTVLGTLAFSVQIYADFWAYSMIARGAGLLLGIEFIWNFNQPYAATSLRDFWRRWHISLSTWLRDYLYIGLGGNRRGPGRTYVNLTLTMVLGGLWHGAAWNFVFWGLLHGLGLAAERALDERGLLEPVPRLVRRAATLAIVLFGWFLFRCHTAPMMGSMLASLGNLEWTARHSGYLSSVVVFSAPLVLFEVW